MIPRIRICGPRSIIVVFMWVYKKILIGLYAVMYKENGQESDIEKVLEIEKLRK